MKNDKDKLKSDTYTRIGTGAASPVAVPILAPGIGTRISAAAELLGTRKNAATVMGVSTDALQRYIREENVPPFDAVARLCAAAGVRLAWIAFETGVTLVKDQKTASQGQSPVVRQEVLIIALQLVDEVLEGKNLEPPKRAELVGLVYEGLDDGLPEAKVLRWARAAVG